MLREFEVHVERSHAEPLADALLAAGALSVAVEDLDADGPGESPLYGEPGMLPAAPAWLRNRLVALAPADALPDELLAAAAAALGVAVPVMVRVNAVADQDWVRATQAQFAPIHVGGRLWVVPSWAEPPDPRALNLRLDPGAAFGTGSHPTTRLCLRWLAAAPMAGNRVLDYGCGSGILSIAAALLGARTVVGTDIDPLALETARHNAAANRVVARYTVPADLPDAGDDARFDIVLANILANPLRVLAPALVARVAAGGSLVLSGILERQAEEIIGSYRAVDPALRLHVHAGDEGWVCLVGQRN